MLLTATSKEECLGFLKRQIDLGRYRLAERDLAELRAVQNFLEGLNILDGD
jgi:hypothetical protein